MTGFPVEGVVDAHVHLMPDRLMQAIREALHDAAGWRFDHPTDSEALVDALAHAGVERFLALPYAARPGAARELNRFVCETTADVEAAVPFATVHAGDDDVGDVVRSAIADGAQGLKLQLPVQGFGPDDDRLIPAYEAVVAADVPVVMHAGTAPMFTDSPHVGVDRFRSFRASFPDVRVCVAHMGTYDVEAFLDIAREDPEVYLDTTFAMSSVADRYMDFDPSTVTNRTLIELSESVMYGSDYPNIPYAYVREREHLCLRELPEEVLRDLFSRTARQFLGED